MVAASCCGGFSLWQGQGDWLESRETWIQSDTERSFRKRAPEWTQHLTGMEIHLSTWHRLEEYNQDNAGVSSGQCPWTAQPKPRPQHLLSRTEHLWRNFKMAVHLSSHPIWLTLRGFTRKNEERNCPHPAVRSLRFTMKTWSYNCCQRFLSIGKYI